jgi:hypothetical protein
MHTILSQKAGAKRPPKTAKDGEASKDREGTKEHA